MDNYSKFYIRNSWGNHFDKRRIDKGSQSIEEIYQVKIRSLVHMGNKLGPNKPLEYDLRPLAKQLVR